MAVTWGEPEISNTSGMQGPQQINAVADFAMLRGIRPFDTVALLRAATGMEEGYWASVTAVPGALWRYTGGTWIMLGEPRFASANARDAAINAPVQDMRIFRTDKRYSQVYTGSAWVGFGGLVPIRPTSVTSGQESGSSITVDPDGAVRFAGTSAIRLNGLFSTDFDRYRIEYNVYGSVIAQGVNGRFSSNGVSETGDVYYFQGVAQSSGGEVGKFEKRPGNTFDLGRCGSDAQNIGVGFLEVVDPARSGARARMTWTSFASDNTRDHHISASGQVAKSGSSYDGFVLHDSSTAKMTGTIRVFGYGRS